LCPGEEGIPLQGLSFWESSPPVGLPESPTRHLENQEAGRRKRLPRRPRMRGCLLKGCKQRFHPRQARQRYCSQRCREAARQWSRWKAQQRYRERVRSRKPAEPEPVKEVARVITTEHFFRPMLRPAGLLRGIPASAAKSLTALLFDGVQARGRARPGAGTAVEEGARFNPEILITDTAGLTFRLSDATGISPA
jgi:hypothetical protein